LEPGQSARLKGFYILKIRNAALPGKKNPTVLANQSIIKDSISHMKTNGRIEVNQITPPSEIV